MARAPSPSNPDVGWAESARPTTLFSRFQIKRSGAGGRVHDRPKPVLRSAEGADRSNSGQLAADRAPSAVRVAAELPGGCYRGPLPGDRGPTLPSLSFSGRRKKNLRPRLGEDPRPAPGARRPPRRPAPSPGAGTGAHHNCGARRGGTGTADTGGETGGARPGRTTADRRLSRAHLPGPTYRGPPTGGTPRSCC